MQSNTIFNKPLLAAIVLSAALPVFGEDFPTPGLYAMTTQVSSEQLPIARTQESEQCIEDNQFMRDPDAWMQKQRGQDCEIVKYEVADGAISMHLECTIEQGGKASITGSGTYTTSSFELTNKMKMNASGMTMEINTAVTGQRKGDC